MCESRVTNVEIINGWKEIATHLRTSVRTVQRWEMAGLPIHRPKYTGAKGPVFAFTEELDAWVKRSRSSEVAGGGLNSITRHRAIIAELSASLARQREIIRDIKARRRELARVRHRTSFDDPTNASQMPTTRLITETIQ
jgi:phage terminase Nu1 subunit (DNA packaging protein)